MPMEVLVRFGRWDEILAEPAKYEDYMPFSRAFHHAARAIAFAAKGDTASARREQATYLDLSKRVPADETFGNFGKVVVTSASGFSTMYAQAVALQPGVSRSGRRACHAGARSS